MILLFNTERLWLLQSFTTDLSLKMFLLLPQILSSNNSFTICLSFQTALVEMVVPNSYLDQNFMESTNNATTVYATATLLLHSLVVEPTVLRHVAVMVLRMQENLATMEQETATQLPEHADSTAVFHIVVMVLLIPTKTVTIITS